MQFKEYYELTEDAELFDLDEGILDLVTTPTKFAAGTAGNVIGQGLRGVGNILSGGFNAASGLGSTALGGLEYLAGSNKAKEKAKRKIRKGIGSVGSGLGSGIKGLTQILSTPVTAPLRGAQLAGSEDEPFSGILAPNDPKRSWTQDLFGLSSGSQDQSLAPDEQWRRLIKIYKSMDRRDPERTKILDQLRKLDPERYAQAKRIGQEIKRQNKTKRFLKNLEKVN